MFKLIPTAFVTNDFEDFIVWNELGHECQRFRYPTVQHPKGGFYPHFMSTYSFTEDLVFIKNPGSNFRVIPKIKGQGYWGNLNAQPRQLIQLGMTISRNGSNIWVIGGSTYLKGTVVTLLPEKETYIVDLM